MTRDLVFYVPLLEREAQAATTNEWREDASVSSIAKTGIVDKSDKETVERVACRVLEPELVGCLREHLVNCVDSNSIGWLVENITEKTPWAAPSERKGRRGGVRSIYLQDLCT